MEIYIVTHKNIKKKIKEKGYLYIGVGPNKNNINCECFDNQGENISEKNPNYCELTAQYYIWKNSRSNIIGLTHYRRQFYDNVFSFLTNRPLSEKKINKTIKKYDLILPKKYKIKNSSIYDYYDKEHFIKDLDMCGLVIQKLYPDYYECFKKLKNISQAVYCNMIITSKKIYDDYSNWLFNILFEVEKNIDISDYDNYQKRIFGFLSERLLNVYILKNNQFKIKYYQIRMLPEDNTFKNRFALTRLNLIGKMKKRLKRKFMRNRY